MTGMYSANIDHTPHDGRHVQGCRKCDLNREFARLLDGPPTTSGLVRHRRRSPRLIERMRALLGGRS